ncbi:BolA family transcriptional regulator [Pseudomonadota bacterium]|jgi:acid stress-induced BolA-like protein IbaG/YrbA|nr:BolA family transcriptional regulator [Pseudomonadota bacterium]|tara:strand:+ start:293 stop:514 length:222 start_codon:yes stop_codon:yes gene_type:complete
MDITNFLKSKFPEAEISFDGEDCNSKVLIVSKQFEGLTSLQRHKLVLGVLREQFQTGELHALSLNTKSPSEIG